MALADPRPGERVLDAACGTGIVTRLTVPKVGTSGKVVGLDLNAGRLGVARSLSSVSEMGIEWHEGDVGALPFSDSEFDLICCQQGFQFFPDKLAASREMFRVLVSGGRLAINTWRPIEHQPGAFAMAKALGLHVSAEAEAFRHTPFALGEADAIEAPLKEAGFRDIVIRPTIKTVHFPSAEAFAIRYVCGIAPLARMVSEVDDAAREAMLQDVGTALQSYMGADGLAIPTESYLATAN